jgi:hypothetical protein
MDFRNWTVTTLIFALAACSGSDAERLVGKSTAGWPADRYFESAHGVVAATQSLAWRIAAPGGAETDIWISGVPLNADKQQPPHADLSGKIAAEQFGTPGVFLRVRDDGALIESFTACADMNARVQCTQSDTGKVVIAHLDDRRVEGAFFSSSKDLKTRYAAAFAAPVRNESGVPPTADILWSKDGGDAGVTFVKFVDAASEKDTATLRSLTIPERAADWDHFGIISAMQRAARQRPRVLAASQQGNAARLWVLSSASDTHAALPALVEMNKIDGTWRFVRMVF